MSHPQIKFSKNWNNKLECNIFTTIRGRYGKFGDKYEHYYSKIGEVFDIVLNGELHAYATLIGVHQCKLIDIPEYSLMVDVGTDIKDVLDTFKNSFGISEKSEVIVLTFRKQRSE